MGWTSDPYKYRIEDLYELKLGEHKQMPKGCVGSPWSYEALGWAGFGFPHNGEFEDGPWGDGCWACNTENGKECASGGGHWGNRGTVRRKDYKGNVNECCIKSLDSPGTKKMDNHGNTCRAEGNDENTINHDSKTCRADLRRHCAIDDRIIKWGECKKLSTKLPDTYSDVMNEFCSRSPDNMQGNECQSFCKSNPGLVACQAENRKVRCNVYSLPTNCSEQQINDMDSTCIRMGITNAICDTVAGCSLAGNQKYACSQKGIDSLKKDCNEVGISSDLCTAPGVKIVQDRSREDTQVRETQRISTQQSTTTQKLMQDIAKAAYDVDVAPEPKPKKVEKAVDPQIWIIIAIVSVICCSSVSAILLLILLPE